MQNGEEVIWLPLERAEALRILQEQVTAGDTWLQMADELSPGIASNVLEFYNAKEDFRRNNSKLREITQDDDTTDREVDNNTGDRMNSLGWMDGSLKTWDARWPQGGSREKTGLLGRDQSP